MKETEQMTFWKGSFGDSYTGRNSQDFDTFYKQEYGVTRTQLNNEFLSAIDKAAPILEVGCNRGAQLDILRSSGFTNLWGIEINKTALHIVKKNPEFNIVESAAQNIPFKDGFFEMTFTSGVLIHISPDDLPKVISEIYRTTRRYIFCFEYFEEKCTEITYRGNSNRLWKNDFLNLFLKQYPSLHVVKKKLVPYLSGTNKDMMFLLEKESER